MTANAENTHPRESRMPRVSLTFDDGLTEHLDIVIPILDVHQLCGTFYVHLSAPAFGPRIDDWKQAARTGHEIGNHTILHPADERKAWVTEGNSLDRYTMDRMRQELQTANQILSGVDDRTERTFAYPCSNHRLGRHGIVRRMVRFMGMERTRVAPWAEPWKATRH